MKHTFDDITSRITEQPSWYDSNGTPRYGAFAPDQCPNIYADAVVLLRIECQACGRRFNVEMHSHWYAQLAHPKKLHYGDPPAHGCVGDTMNCEDLEVLEVWRKDRERYEWVRHPELEGPIE